MFDKAIIFAIKAHSGSFRKGTTTPYIVHPMEAAAIVATMTDDKAILAATVLHDVVEDTSYTIDDIMKEFGEDVTRLVSAETEDKRNNLPSETTWKTRKQETLDHLRDKATKAEKMITLGDKLSNIRAIYKDYLEIGDELWKKFNQKNKEEHAWYYKSIAELLSDLSDTPAHKEYVELVNKVFNE
ncbi:HD domain-containing protein [Candidatus Saccharibacteria bacterium]|nr:HD domain-containing protein [Candidatus Saccharibacteria bacterium]